MATLKPWTLPSSYVGKTWDGYLIAPVARNRDSDLLTESNWDAQIEALKAADIVGNYPDEAPEAWQIVRASHWACGWVEWVAIYPRALATMKAMCELADRLEQYPVLNESDWSKREHDDAIENFDRHSVRDLSKDLAETFGLRAPTIARWEEISADKVLSFMLEKVNYKEIMAEGGSAYFRWVSFEHAPVTRADLARFLWANRRG